MTYRSVAGPIILAGQMGEGGDAIRAAVGARSGEERAAAVASIPLPLLHEGRRAALSARVSCCGLIAGGMLAARVCLTGRSVLRRDAPANSPARADRAMNYAY